MRFCEYKNLLGEPNKGLRTFRIFNLSVIDTVVTISAAYFISFYFKKSFLFVLFILFILGIFAHYIFCVRTTIDILLFT